MTNPPTNTCSGSIYSHWAKLLVEAGEQEAASAKWDLAAADFQYYVDNAPGTKAHSQKIWVGKMNIALVMAGRGHFSDAEVQLVASVRQRLRGQLARAMETDLLRQSTTGHFTQQREPDHQITPKKLMQMVTASYQLGARTTGRATEQDPDPDTLTENEEVREALAACFAALARATCQHALETKREIPSITLG